MWFLGACFPFLLVRFGYSGSFSLLLQKWATGWKASMEMMMWSFHASGLMIWRGWGGERGKYTFQCTCRLQIVAGMLKLCTAMELEMLSGQWPNEEHTFSKLQRRGFLFAMDRTNDGEKIACTPCDLSELPPTLPEPEYDQVCGSFAVCRFASSLESWQRELWLGIDFCVGFNRYLWRSIAIRELF